MRFDPAYSRGYLYLHSTCPPLGKEEKRGRSCKSHITTKKDDWCRLSLWRIWDSTPRIHADIYIYIPPVLLWERREKEVVHANHISPQKKDDRCRLSLWRIWDSNSRPLACHASALTNWAKPPIALQRYTIFINMQNYHGKIQNSMAHYYLHLCMLLQRPPLSIRAKLEPGDICRNVVVILFL